MLRSFGFLIEIESDERIIMKEEVIWKYECSEDFLKDVRDFARSLDFYSINFNLESEQGKCVRISDGKYQIMENSDVNSFECPNCGHKTFEVLEGKFEGKEVLGLACETYGAVFLAGLWMFQVLNN